MTLANSAQHLWRELEKRTGHELLHFTSALLVGPSDHPALKGLTDSARRHGLPYETLDAPALERRFPALRSAPDDVAVLELDAGVLFADRCNAAHLQAARAAGARVAEEQSVFAITPAATGVEVRTSRGMYRARHVVVTAGPWLPALLDGGIAGLPGLGVSLRVERQVELWFAADGPEDFEPARLPLFHFVLADRQRSYYGIPRFDARGVKVCRHYGGATVTADTVERGVLPSDEEDVRGFLRDCIPRANRERLGGKVCLNTNTPDMNFIVGPHPADDRIVLAGGFSGHGFKYAPVVGEIVADLVTEGATPHPIGLFSPARFTSR